MNAFPDHNEELLHLFEKAAYGTLSETEGLNLQQALKQDSSAQRLWFEFNDVECGLAGLLAPPRIRGRKDADWKKNPQQLMFPLLPALVPSGA
jgi:hypothetical protein